jgi:tripartite-type tricarboxylate transporter receptor subunit TctC
VTTPTIYSVNSAASYRSLVDLLDAARDNPGALTLASSGPASPFQIELRHAANVNMTFVPFPGGDIWYGLVAPARTPKAAIVQLTDWLTTAMKVPEIHQKLAVQGLNPDSRLPERMPVMSAAGMTEPACTT